MFSTKLVQRLASVDCTSLSALNSLPNRFYCLLAIAKAAPTTEADRELGSFPKSMHHSHIKSFPISEMLK
jgi:hypothetical protein